MRPTAILLASVVGTAVLAVGTSASGSGGASLQGGESNAARAGAVHRALAHIAQKKLRKPCKRCKNLVVGQGSGGQGLRPTGSSSTRASPRHPRVLKFVTDQTGKGATENFFYTTAAGDLLFAAIVTDGATITPPAGWQAVPGSDVSDATGRRLQIFYSIPVPLSALAKSDPGDRIGPDSHSFSASAAGAMRGVLFNVSGADQAAPIDAAAARSQRNALDRRSGSIARRDRRTHAAALLRRHRLEADVDGACRHEAARVQRRQGAHVRARPPAAAIRFWTPVRERRRSPVRPRASGRCRSEDPASDDVSEDAHPQPAQRRDRAVQGRRRRLRSCAAEVPVEPAMHRRDRARGPGAGGGRRRLGAGRQDAYSAARRVPGERLRCPKCGSRPPRRTPGLFVQVLLEAPNGQLVESTDRRVDGGVLTLR